MKKTATDRMFINISVEKKWGIFHPIVWPSRQIYNTCRCHRCWSTFVKLITYEPMSYGESHLGLLERGFQETLLVLYPRPLLTTAKVSELLTSGTL